MKRDYEPLLGCGSVLAAIVTVACIVVICAPLVVYIWDWWQAFVGGFK